MELFPFAKAISRLQIDFGCPTSSCIHEPSPVADQVSGPEVGVLTPLVFEPLDDEDRICAMLSSEPGLQD